ncbi:hypothetical protein OROMI_011493 [Orobanche minor]
MDKSWMHAARRSQEFDLGVDEFIMFALESGCDVNKVSCPCSKCAHGQSWKAMTGESDDEGLADDPEEFLRVVEDGDKPLYPGYMDDNVDAISCSTCGVSRWKLGDGGEDRVDVPAKVLWYFPPIPRFKKMFQLVSTAKSLIWHDNERVQDDKMRHPADSPTWKMVDDQWPSFGADPRNLSLALSSDGFNPHSTLSSKYSCWPGILVIYNLPPWLCFKRKYMMLTLLISGPKQPGNDINVYLQPLIDDLKKLWSGVEGVFDNYKKVYFTLRAVLFWTINNFPAYGNLSGSIVKGYNGCPVCLEHTKPHRLADAFDATVEVDTAPIPLSGEEVLQRVEGLKVKFGKPLPKITAKGGLKGKNGKSGLKGKKKVVAEALAVKKSTLRFKKGRENKRWCPC